MKKTIITLALVAAGSTNAFAWGDREQGILAGAAATLLLQHIHNHRHPPVVVQQPPVVIQQPPVIVQQPPVIASGGGVITDRPLTCVSRPVLWDPNSGMPIRYETTCR